MGCTWCAAERMNKVDPENHSRNQSVSVVDDTLNTASEHPLDDQSAPVRVEDSVNPSMNDRTLESINDVSNHLAVAVLHNSIKTVQQTSENDQHRSSRIHSGTSNKYELFSNGSDDQQITRRNEHFNQRSGEDI